MSMSSSFRSDGLTLYRKGHYTEALDAFFSENELQEDSELSYYIGLCYVRLNEKEKAISSLRKVLKNNNRIAQRYQAWMLLVWLHIQKNDIAEAIKICRDILKESFRSPQIWSVLGYCYWHENNIELALKCYRKAVDIDDQNPNAANGLGYLLAESGEEPAMAVTLCRRALNKAPKNIAYKDSLGWALFKSGEISEALRYLREAMLDRPGDKIIENHLETVKRHE